LVVNVLAGGVGRDVTADGVTVAGGTVRVELTAKVAVGDVDLGEVSPAHDLPVQRGLDKVDGLEGSVGDDTGVVSRLCKNTDQS
jgi:hypothetical protein